MDMEITLHYATTRQQLLGLYWYMWRIRLWKYHLFALVVGGVASLYMYLIGANAPFIPILLAFMYIVGLFLFPQMNYKPQTRELILSPDGLKTTIGTRSGTASWAEISKVIDRDGYVIIIRKNLNSFIIPAIAFASDEERTKSLKTIMAWIASAHQVEAS